MTIQTPTPAPSLDKVVCREFVQNKTRAFRVHLFFGPEEDKNEVDYILVSKCTLDKNVPNRASWSFRVEDYTTRAEGQRISRKLAGGGTLVLDQTGLPEMLSANCQNTHLWYPLLAFYLPAETTSGKFQVDQALSPRSTFVGEGAIEKGGYSFSGSVDEAKTPIAKVALTWTLDKQGWPLRAKGEITDSSGTINFSLRAT